MGAGLVGASRQAAPERLTQGETEPRRWLWTTAVSAVGETPSLTPEFLEKSARDEQAGNTVPSLASPP